MGYALALALGLVCLTSCAARHRASGLVLDVRAPMVTISHAEIPGVMPAMAMEFRAASPEELKDLRPGSRVDFVMSGQRAKRIRAQASVFEGVDRELPLRKPAETLKVGDAVPDFTLTDHRGQPFTLSQAKGRVVAVNFVYTRCPLPEVCPRLSAQFAQLQKRFAGREVTLLSVTLDPQYDTVPVLDEYARRWRADGDTWHLLTGQLKDVAQVAARFGMIYWPEQGLLTHTSMTGVIDRQGRLRAIIEGSSYQARQLGDLIERVQESR
ncbi:MAG: SCO family protein [Bryobacteraceae bacterium]|nr:SCO family protein [Bryobacteraceae bacterium]